MLSGAKKLNILVSPIAKGGGYRKWYGNLIDVVDWSYEAREEYRTGHGSQIIPENYWYYS